MGSFTSSEVLTILVVILILFGPNRLPEVAKRAGDLAGRIRRAVDGFRAEVESEYGEALQPLQDARNDLRAAGAELKGSVKAVTDELGAAKDEVIDSVAKVEIEEGSLTDEPFEGDEPGTTTS